MSWPRCENVYWTGKIQAQILEYARGVSAFSILQAVPHNDSSQASFWNIEGNEFDGILPDITSWNSLCSGADYVQNPLDGIPDVNVNNPSKGASWVGASCLFLGWTKAWLWQCLGSSYNSDSVIIHGWMQGSHHSVSVEHCGKNLSRKKKKLNSSSFLWVHGEMRSIFDQGSDLSLWFHFDTILSQNHLRMALGTSA
jgi:hypothetical protein